jgi:hypothetical protein
MACRRQVIFNLSGKRNQRRTIMVGTMIAKDQSKVQDEFITRDYYFYEQLS